MAAKSKTPEIRFKGFTDPWEQRKLGELCEITSGYMGDATLTSGKYRLTRIETISKGEINEARVGYTNKEPDEQYRLHVGDILFSNINSLSYIGNVALYRHPTGLFHGINLLKIRSAKSIEPAFLFRLLTTEKKRGWAKEHANPAVSQASINQSLLAEQPMDVCQSREQTAIASYFDTLDTLITLHQRKR